MSEFLDDRWTREAVRLHRRYQMEVVEACGLCPWAERARVDDSFRARVLLQSDARDRDASIAAIDSLIGDTRVAVAVLIYPRLRLRRADFEQFVAEVRVSDAARHPLGGIPFVFAAFHPAAAPDASDPERLVPFLRRTPDPTIQLLRSSVLESVRGAAPSGTQFIDHVDFSRSAQLPLRERITLANFATAKRIGLAAMTTRFEDIERDRNAAYRALENATGEAEAVLR